MEKKMKKKVTILIIGGTGFIGSHLVQKAKKINLNVIILNKTGKISSGNIFKSVKFIKVNFTNRKQLRKKISKLKIDYIINSGGYINHDHFSSKMGKLSLLEHFDSVRNLVSCVDRSKIKKFLQICSSDEYGDALSPQNENLREKSISPYSFGKVASTHFLQMLHKTENFPVSIVRIFLTYGPGQNNKRFFPQIINGCLDNRSFKVSKGNQLRDFCYIEDVVDAIYKILFSKKTVGKILNIGSGKPIKIKNMIKKVVKLIGSGQPIFGALPYRKGENMSLYADTKEIFKILKWRPKISLNEGLKRTIKYYKKNGK
jgi:nucleoside-diphosphate-sugar epimerase